MDGHGDVEKFPSEILDIEFSFRDWLLMQFAESAADAIAEADAGLTAVLLDLQGDAVHVRISAGSANTDYTVAAEITTAGGQVKRIERRVRVRQPVQTTSLLLSYGGLALTYGGLSIGVVQ
jgi:hypothetical protein